MRPYVAEDSPTNFVVFLWLDYANENGLPNIVCVPHNYVFNVILIYELFFIIKD